ncbi:hypothetical protein G7Y41_07825 [Schaalia sp. ZJ405]|uniref:FtsX-like permease family protein n=1 Tax=Schaalia sp. ZJ405 TaxID=2709403 RepID=UPI0013EA06F5|nr:ABC transporter permease [Schaalia sp. ZJ405]QPK80949.1 hypothetical protein G7Y41_07825 [Schaalia sp. ZJ405]
MIRSVLYEVFASIRSQTVTSLILVLLIAGASASVILTAGQSAGAQASVLSTVDSLSPRTINVYVSNNPPEFNATLVETLKSYDLIESVTGFGPAADVTAAVNPEGARVSTRAVYGNIGTRMPHWVNALNQAETSQSGETTSPEETLGFADETGLPPRAVSTKNATDLLGFTAGVGVARFVPDGEEILVTDSISLPEHLDVMGPMLLIPRPMREDEPLAALAVSAARPEDVDVVTAIVRGYLREVPSENVTVSNSKMLADLRSAISGEITASNRTLIIGSFAAASAASIIVVWTVVLLRRKDFGRRRALGASRSAIVGLVLAQVWTLGVIGALAGFAIGIGALGIQGAVIPPPDFNVAVVVGMAAGSVIAALIPATWAAWRDPLTELRVP